MNESKGPDAQAIYDLQGRLGPLSSAITTYGRMLSGAVPISRTTLTMAQAEGRNYLADIGAKHARYVRERLDIANKLAAMGAPARRHAEYLAAAQALEASAHG